MMKYLTTIILLSFLFPVSWAHAQSPDFPVLEAEKILRQRGELYFSFPSMGRIDMDRITTFVSIDHHQTIDRVFAYANPSGFQNFLNLKIPFRIETAPGQTGMADMATDSRGMQNWDYYPTWDQYQALVQSFASQYPGICSLTTIGHSVQGRELYMLKISDQVAQDEPEPEVLLTGSIHGDELTGYILLLRMAEYLLENYGSDPLTTDLVNDLEIYINPLSNPDGSFAGGNQTVGWATRFNANLVDLNRNYPDPEDGLHPDGNAWQPENVAMMDFLRDRAFVLAVNLHDGAEVVNYPWDTWPRLHPDNDWYFRISRAWADTVHANTPVSMPGYFSFMNNGITNGYAWYSVNGGRADYANYYQFMREVLVEISNDKIPPGSQLPNIWQAQYRSILNYMAEARLGIRGIITDSLTGNPIQARLDIPGHDQDNSFIVSSSTGNYHRFLAAGTYDLRFSSAGYQTKDFEEVTVGDAGLILNVALFPINGIQESPAQENPVVGLWPNPVNETLWIELNLKKPEKIRLRIQDISGNTTLVYSEINATPGPFLHHVSVSSLQPGFYLCSFEGPIRPRPIPFIKL